MKSSPVQLVEIRFDKISIEANKKFADNSSVREGVTLQSKESCEPLTNYWDDSNPPPIDGANTRTFLVSLGLRTSSGEAENTPYNFEVIGTGIVMCVKEKILNLDADEAARQYGLAMIYGAVREVVLNLTGRMRHGQRLLPTASFMEPSRVAKKAEEEKAKKLTN